MGRGRWAGRPRLNSLLLVVVNLGARDNGGANGDKTEAMGNQELKSEESHTIKIRGSGEATFQVGGGGSEAT